MISKEALKEIITLNEEFILHKLPEIIPRKGLRFPGEVNKAVIFYGMRRSGKSCILFDLFRKHKENALYIDFEDERIRGFTADDFSSLKEVFLDLKPQLHGKQLIFLLDEVQNVRDWEKYVRRAVERENIKVFVSGSSSKVMPKEIQTALRGRSWTIEVTPFSFPEYLSLRGLDIYDSSSVYGKNKAQTRKTFADYFKWGGFPEVLLLKSDFEKRKIIREYLEAMFFKDLVERFNITNTHLLLVLLESLFSSFSSKFSLYAFYKNFSQKFPFSKDSLFSYYRHLLECMLIFEVKKFSESVYKRNRNPAKIYTADISLCRRVTSQDSGRLLENLVFLELRRRNVEVFYFEEKKECDFICRNMSGVFEPYQVTFELGENNEPREIEGVLEACRYLSSKKGVILTNDQEGTRKVERVEINILPVWKWLLQTAGKNRY